MELYYFLVKVLFSLAYGNSGIWDNRIFASASDINGARELLQNGSAGHTVDGTSGFHYVSVTEKHFKPTGSFGHSVNPPAAGQLPLNGPQGNGSPGLQTIKAIPKISVEDHGSAIIEDPLKLKKAQETDHKLAYPEAVLGENEKATPLKRKDVPSSATQPGITGPRGQRGAQGPVSPPGKTGSRGPIGPPGEAGPPGHDGPSGARGPSGQKGPDGLPGPRGPTGLTGARGKPGYPGDKGFTGPKGVRGPRGHRGAPGPPGPEGFKGLPGSVGPRLSDEQEADEFCSGKKDGYYTVKESCNKYYICRTLTSLFIVPLPAALTDHYIVTCPPGHYFNPAKQECQRGYTCKPHASALLQNKNENSYYSMSEVLTLYSMTITATLLLVGVGATSVCACIRLRQMSSISKRLKDMSEIDYHLY